MHRYIKWTFLLSLHCKDIAFFLLIHFIDLLKLWSRIPLRSALNVEAYFYTQVTDNPLTVKQD